MQFSSKPTLTLQAIPDGPEGILATLKIMRQLVRSNKTNIRIRQLGMDLIRSHNLRDKDWSGQIRVLHAFVRDRIKYLRDINGVETLQTPDYTLDNRQGDCDDKSILLASLLESTGHPTRFVAVGFHPGHYAHVLVEAKVGEKWVSLETTEPVEAGWYPPGVVSRMVVHNR
jgi:hypothetical protein